MIETLYLFSVASIVLAVSPGPDNIFVLTQSLSNGSKSGIAISAGLVSGCIVHTSLLAFGVSAIIISSDGLFYAIKIIGACYLLFLAYRVYRSNTMIDFNQSTSGKSYLQLFKTGVIMNLVNPKVLIFFLALFPGFLWDPSGNTIGQFYVLGLLFMGISFVVFSAISLLAGSISVFLSKQKSVAHILKWLQILVFVGIAIYILLP